jgi:hypothetical protein
MKSVIASIVAVAGLTVAANAATTVQMLVSTDGTNFSNQVVLTPNSGMRTVEVLVSVSNTGTNAIGLGSMIFQPTVSNWAATDAILPFTNGGFGSNQSTPSGAVADAPGQYGRISPFAAVNLTSAQRLFGHVHLTSGGLNQPPSGTYLRIAQAQVTSWIGGQGNTSGGSGVNIKQLNNIGRTTNDPAFLGALTNVHVLRFAINVDTAQVGRFPMIVDAPNAGFGNLNTTTGNREVYWYADMNEGTGSIREVPTIVTGSIVVPAPASLALLGLGGLAVARRRR